MTDRNLKNIFIKGDCMSKSSKSCGYTGHMKTMNKINETQEIYSSQQAKNHGLKNSQSQSHVRHKADYPEVIAKQRAQASCGCKETSFKRF